MSVEPVILRTLSHEYRLHLPSALGRERFAFLITDPVIEGLPLEVVDIPIEETQGFYRLELPSGKLVEGTSTHCIDVFHGLMIADLLKSHTGHPTIHAASVVIGGKRLLIAGGKGAGKSTLALYLLSRGHEVEGDEHLVILGDKVVARPRTLRIKPDTFRLLKGLPPAVQTTPFYPTWHGAPLHAVSPALFGRPWRISPGRLDAIVFAEANHGGRSLATPLPANDAFARLVANAYFLKSGIAQMAGRLRALAVSIPAYKLRLGDLTSAEWHLKTLVGS
jgi:hypothetical protein